MKYDFDGYELTEAGLQKVNIFIAECQAKRKEILDAGKDTADDTTLPTVEDIISDLSFMELDPENNDYYNAWGVTDNYDSDDALHLEFIKDFIDAEEKNNILDARNWFAKEIAYELYKQDWIRTHLTEKDWKESANTYISSLDEADYNPGFGFEVADFIDDINENGFGSGQLYVCFEEFLGTEFLDQEYIRRLVGEGPLLDVIETIWEDEENEKA